MHDLEKRKVMTERQVSCGHGTKCLDCGDQEEFVCA
jgi:hypothetical protein